MRFAGYTCNRCDGRRVGIGEYTAMCSLCMCDRFEDEQEPEHLRVRVATTTDALRNVDNPGLPSPATPAAQS